jgi:predicted RNase H-like HicB family nuclease
MLYAAYVRPGDAEHAHGVTLPDFPGCFSAADAWEDIPSKVGEALELYFEGEELEIPMPTPLAEQQQNPDYADGVWLLLDLDLTRVRPKAKRINITLPEPLLARIDEYARDHRMTRSGFLAAAAARLMATPPPARSDNPHEQ